MAWMVSSRRRFVIASVAAGVASALLTSCSSSSSSQPSAPATNTFCGHVSQVLGAENALAVLAPTLSSEHIGLADTALSTYEAQARSLSSDLKKASERSPTSSLKQSLSALALQVSSAMTFGGPVATLQLKAQDAISGLTPLYRQLEQQCPMVISSQKPSFHQRAEFAAKTLVEDAAVTASGRGQPFTQADVNEMLAMTGHAKAERITVAKALGMVAHQPDLMAFTVTNLGGTWLVCVRSAPMSSHSLNDVMVVSCPSGTTSHPMMK